MRRTLILIVTFLICGLESQIAIRSASATTTLTSAIIQLIRNEVELMPQGEPARPASVEDEMVPGDALSTARESFAELTFNDGSLARVGERVLFRFVPNTRTFRLDNGTVLLLIPPGQGRTNLRTPNATAGIRGSALFVRYIEETDTTLVGALTDSGIQVFNHDETERYELKPGEMAVVIEDRIHRIYQFDLERFYETSQLTAGLGLGTVEYYANRGQIETPPESEALTLVRSETLTALENHEFDETLGEVIESPEFTQMTATVEDLQEAGLVRSSSEQSSVADREGDRSEQLDRVFDATEVQNDLIEGSPGIGDRPSPAMDRQPDPGDQRPDPQGGTDPGNRPGSDNPSNRPPNEGPEPNPGNDRPSGPDDRDPPNTPPRPGGNDRPDPGDDDDAPGGDDGPSRGPDDSGGIDVEPGED
ncbi:MAG: FecR family protein [Leptolyngbyaceae bacterium]|nr:FecR family protein [Leptolyngbyaceae bacterium]